MNPAEQVSTSQNRNRIPSEWALEFYDWSDDALASMADDPAVATDKRAWARYELDYRRAFGIVVDYHPITHNLRHLGSTAEYEAAIRVEEQRRDDMGPTEAEKMLARMKAAGL